MGRPRKDAFDESTTIRVLRAAEEVFGERGFANARLEDIAAQASIRRSSLLYHFGSKDNLYQQVVDRAFSEIAGAMARGMGHGTTYEEKVEATITELLAFQEEHEQLMAVVLRALLTPSGAGHDTIGAKFSVLVDQLEEFVVTAGESQLPKGLPVRAIILQLIVTHLAHAAMGDLGDKLWKGHTHTRDIARRLLLSEVR
jgi:AcrR family transcriptional regulator